MERSSDGVEENQGNEAALLWGMPGESEIRLCAILEAVRSMRACISCTHRRRCATQTNFHRAKLSAHPHYTAHAQPESNRGRTGGGEWTRRARTCSVGPCVVGAAVVGDVVGEVGDTVGESVVTVGESVVTVGVVVVACALTPLSPPNQHDPTNTASIHTRTSQVGVDSCTDDAVTAGADWLVFTP